MTEEYKEVCIHEASHLVFNRLLQKLDIDFPQPKYAAILEPGQGRIEGGWIVENNTANAYGQLQVLKAKSKKCKIAQIMFSLAGFVSFQSLVDEGVDKCRLEWISIGNGPSDIEKCNKVAGQISESTLVNKEKGGWHINDENLEVLNPIKDSVKSLMKVESIRTAIFLAANKLYENKGKQIEGEQLQLLCQEIDSTIEGVDVNGEIEKLL